MTDPIEPLEEALEATPQNVPLRLYLGRLLLERGYRGRAIGHFRQALELEPGSLDASLGLGAALQEEGESIEAVRVLTRALGMDPEPAQAARLHLVLARALLALGQVDDARGHYRNAIRRDASSADRDLAAQLYEAELPPEAGMPIRMPSEDHELPPLREEGKPGITFRDVGGMEELKEMLRRAIVYPFQQPEIYRAYGKKIGGGILLYGPPGCGKTYIARASAGEIEANFIAVGLSDIMDMWYGESERKLHELFEGARRQAPAVLFFDEIEALGHARSRMSHFTAGRTLVNQFLSEMDGIASANENLLIVGATNSPWDLDPAFRRPGRFDRILFIAPPDRAARVEIMKLHLRDKPLDVIDYERVAGRMERFSGADIRNVCELAAERALEGALRTGAIRKIDTSDLLEALKQVRSSTAEWLETARTYARYSDRSGLYTDVIHYLERKG